MILKRPLDPQRLRSLPPSGFGWIDHRFLRDGCLQRCAPSELALYSLLVCAADSRGLSFYSDARAAELLRLDPHALRAARDGLIDAQLIVFEKPVYQLLRLGSGENRRSVDDGQSARRPIVISPAPRPPIAPAPRQWPVETEPLPVPAPAGLNLRVMVEASLGKGGAQ